jgi:hypothetical protein
MDSLIAGSVIVRNPYNANKRRVISLEHENVDAIVFWTKYPEPIVKSLDEIEKRGIAFYFLFTLNPYNAEIEPYLPSKQEIIRSFKRLSAVIGPERVIWRYDPILITNEFDIQYHLAHFDQLSSELRGYTEKCIVSFVSFYRKCEKALKAIGTYDPGSDYKLDLLERMQTIVNNKEISLASCAVALPPEQTIIQPARCVDNLLINKLSGRNLPYLKDKNQRPSCNCTQSVDIGEYGSCSFGCNYCYASLSATRIKDS